MTSKVDDFVPITQAASLPYPCVACACFDHFGTGEGRTIGLIVMHAVSAEALMHVIHRDFGAFYSGGAYVGLWQRVPEGFEALDPRLAFDALDQQFEDRPSFQYSAKLHFNAS